MPVMEINPRFVSRLYPADGGKGAFWLCSVRCAVVENSLLCVRQRPQTEGRGRIMVELVLRSQCEFIYFFTKDPMTLGGGLWQKVGLSLGTYGVLRTDM
jgi:hypothetical protein